MAVYNNPDQVCDGERDWPGIILVCHLAPRSILSRNPSHKSTLRGIVSGSQNLERGVLTAPLFKFLIPCHGETLCELALNEVKEVLPGLCG